MKLQTVWTKAVVVIYLVAIIGVCLYIPSYYTPNKITVDKFDYRWVWSLNLVEHGVEDAGSWGKKYVWAPTVQDPANMSNKDIWIPKLQNTTSTTLSPLSVDYGRAVLEVVGLTVIAGVLFLIGLFVEDRKRGKQSDPSTL